MNDRRRAGAERVYDVLLRVYPAAFRDRFGLQLLEFFRDKRRAAIAAGRIAMLAFWIRIVADALFSALMERARQRPLIPEALMEGWQQDLRYALRVTLRRPALSIVIVATLALGIGANTAIFSLVNTVLLHGAPYPRPDRLVRIWETKLADTGGGPIPVRPANFFDWKARAASFDDVAWSRDATFNISGDGVPETLIGYRFSANMLEVLGMPPMMGRGFTSDDDKPGAAKVVILSHTLWQRRYGADPHIIGHTLTLNGEANTVIGVMPPEFRHPAGTEIWAPIGLTPALMARRDVGVLRLVGRLKPGVTREQAQAEINSIYKDLTARFADAAGLSAHIAPLADAGDAKALLAVLAGAVGFVLLIACANVANLLLADAASRRRELALRGALGASRYRVVRQLLTESVLLAMTGGAIAMLVTWWTRDALIVLFPTNISNLNLPRVEKIDVSLPVFAFAVAVSAGTGLLFGLLPAWISSRANLQDALQDGGRAGSASRRTHGALVVAEVALSTVLLAGALLMVQSFVRLQQQRLGFEPDGVLGARMSLPRYRYADQDAMRRFTRALVDRLKAIPGVDTVGVTNYLPLSGWWDEINFTLEGQPAPPPGSETNADLRVASEDYFRSMGIQVVSGRAFGERDNPSAPRVIVVNQLLARRYLHDENPVGRRLMIDVGGGAQAHEIVGVVADVKSFGLEEPTHAELFFPYAQFPFPLMGVTLRTRGDPASLAGPLREAVWSIDRDQPITHLLPMSQLVSESLAFRRAGMALAGGFGALALVLATIGIYGVLNYSVSRRTREIGIRVALGATRGGLARLVLREGLALTGAGVAIGAIAALLLLRYLSSVLFQVRPGDPVTYVAVAATLFGVGVLATWLPARRASAVDPLVALRME